MLMRRQQGVSLVELMVGISIVAFLLATGMPAFTRWLQDAQNRAAAESVLNGLQLARMESLRRSMPVRFSLTDADGKVAWRVGCPVVTANCPATIQARPAQEGGGGARLGVSTDAIPDAPAADHFAAAIAAGSGLTAEVVFDSLGRAPGAANGTGIARIDVTHVNDAAARRYVVTVGAGGQLRMCDPALALASNPQGCS